MPFTSPLFLSIVLPAFIGVCFSIPKEWRNTFLLVGSLLFYFWIEPVAIVVMVLLATANHVLSGVTGKWRKNALLTAVILDVGVLAFYKYNGWFLDQIDSEMPRFPLAAGISFYTFQLISYVVDAGKTKAPSRSFRDLLLYVCFLPKIPCGPIARFDAFTVGKGDRCANGVNIASGLRLFFCGLAKKVLVADMLARVADPVFGTPASQIPCAYCWLGALAYSLQIYFDFSGYSDMAIGLARIFNYDLPRNFDFPYASRTLQEFWRRWHMSLSLWLRDYIYIPLGGGRCGKARACLNIMVVFLLCGTWHGSSWTFFVWGAFHGIVLVLERLGLKKVLDRLPPILANAYLLLVVLFGWVLFRSPSIEFALTFIRNMILGNPDVRAMDFAIAAQFVTYGEAFILVGAMAASFPVVWKAVALLDKRTKGVLFVVVATMAYVFAMSGTVSPGIYENF